jgi:hypothetical protein
LKKGKNETKAIFKRAGYDDLAVGRDGQKPIADICYGKAIRKVAFTLLSLYYWLSHKFSTAG